MPTDLSINHMYCLFSPDGRMTPFRMLTEYAKNNNADGYIVTETASSNQGIASTSVRFIKFTHDQVLVTRIFLQNALGTNKDQVFDPPSVLLKLPKGNETVAWISKETGQNFTARFITLKEDDQTNKYLVTYRRDGNVTEAKYYFTGVGLVKTEMIKNGESTVMFRLVE